MLDPFPEIQLFPPSKRRELLLVTAIFIAVTFLGACVIFHKELKKKSQQALHCPEITELYNPRSASFTNDFLLLALCCGLWLVLLLTCAARPCPFPGLLSPSALAPVTVPPPRVPTWGAPSGLCLTPSGWTHPPSNVCMEVETCTSLHICYIRSVCSDISSVPPQKNTKVNFLHVIIRKLQDRDSV